MAPKKKRSKNDPLETYRRIRKPMPPPEQVIADKRRKLDEEETRRQIDEARGGNER